MVLRPASRPAPRALRRCFRAGLAGVLAAGVAVVVTVGAPGAQAASYANYEMPFPCGQLWTGTTRSYHSPSANSVDFNRPDDLDDVVVAAAAGTVITAYSYPSGGYGRWVRIDHGQDRTTIYAHLNSTAVKVGQRVRRGQVIGRLGTSGNSTGPHLHFEQRKGSSVLRPRFHGAAYGYGTSRSKNCRDSSPPPPAPATRGDIPLAGNTRLGRRADLVIFRPSRRAVFHTRRQGKPALMTRLGGPLAQPLLGDWDGDGHEQPGVRIPERNQFRLLSPSGKRRTLTWGRQRDLPLAGDWDGDGDVELGLHRPGRRKVLLRSDGGDVRRLWLGDRDDIAVAGDWDGDGTTDTAAFDPDSGVFTLRTFQPDGSRSIDRVQYGRAGDVPVAADWDGDGTTDLGVWRPRRAVYFKRKASSPTSGTWETARVRFGRKR